jgi:hypothetical protein
VKGLADEVAEVVGDGDEVGGGFEERKVGGGVEAWAAVDF